MILFSLSSLCMLGGKCLSISFRNCLPRLVVTDALKGGLYHTICLLRVLVRLRVSLFLPWPERQKFEKLEEIHRERPAQKIEANGAEKWSSATL